MDRITYFVDVLLPLPLVASFTYRVPFELNENIEIGKRVVVQFGVKKLYSGIITNIHNIAPNYNNIKYVLTVLDERPIVNDIQLKFWKWIAEYYMAYEGDVYNAAMPSSLKLASESKLIIHPDFNGNYDLLNDKEYSIIQALELNESITITEASKIVSMQNVMPLIKTLVEKKNVYLSEDLYERFKPKTESFVRINEIYLDADKLEQLTKELENKAFKQLELLLAFLKYSGYFTSENIELTKAFLLKKSDISVAIFAALEKKGVFEVYQKSISRLIEYNSTKTVDSIKLSQSQQKAFEKIKENFNSKNICLLHGVTGSGKTEIYIKLIDDCLKLNKQILFLVPEIALTAQLINRLRQYFGKQLGFYHSKYGNNERVEVWQNLISESSNKYKIIIGARSAIFLPFSNLGLIIVDEEHDASYKQYDPSPRYNARDSAIVLANFHQAKCLLGSATPSLESYYASKNGKYSLVELKERYSNINLPEILIVDTLESIKKKEMKSHFSEFLLKQMSEALSKKEQIILFQNRRGFSLRLVCESCQWTPVCNNCDVGLTYHKQQSKLKCHYCGYSKDIPTQCPECKGIKLAMKGFGTEKIEEEIPLFFPQAVVKRMDLDTTRSKNAYLDLINEFEDRKIDILVGTQMVSKGLDFDHVSLVGVMNADNMLHYPDFRAFERSFQQLVQVSGRSGRKFKRGKVVIQTSEPYHYVIQNVMNNDYRKMYSVQMEERINFKYPPFYRIIKITLKHKEYHTLDDGANYFAESLRFELGQRVLGPEYPAVGRIKNLYLKNILIKFEAKTSHLAIKNMISKSVNKMYFDKNFKSIIISIDVDPQ